MKVFKKVSRSLLGIMMIVIGFSGVAMAQDKASDKLEKMDAYSVKMYEQYLNMGGVYHPKGAFNWDQIKSYIPSVLPESQTKSKSPEDLCDHMDLLHTLYSKDNKAAVNALAEDFEKIKPLSKDVKKNKNGLHPYYQAVLTRLEVSSDKGVGELLKSFPEDQSVRIFALRRSVISELLISYVHDAALLSCSGHARIRGYKPIWVPSAVE